MAQTDRNAGLVAEAAIKNPVKAATTANITLSGEQTVDGVALVEGDRCLVKNQTDATENGIYEVSTGTWSRTKDFNGAYDAVKGTSVYVNTGGTSNGNSIWYVSTDDVIDIGTDSISFVVDTTNITGILEDLNTLGAPSSDGEFIVATGPGVFAYEAGATARTSLGLGSAAVEDIGTSGDAIGKLNANLTWSGTNTFQTDVFMPLASDESCVIGHTAGVNQKNVLPKLQLQGGDTYESIGLIHYSTTESANAQILFGRTRSTVVGTLGTAVQDGDDLGAVEFYGDDGTDLLVGSRACRVSAEVDGTVATDIVPGAIDIWTTDSSGVFLKASRFDSSQRLIVSPQPSISTFFVEPRLQVHGRTADEGALSICCYNATDNIGPSLNFGKSGGATINTFTTVADDERLGDIYFTGADGTDFENAAVQIGVRVDGTVAANQIPGRFFISTANTAGTLTEALRIDAAQRVVIGGAASQTNFFVTPALQVLGTGGASSSSSITCYSTVNATTPNFIMSKSGAGSIGSHTAVVDDEGIANLYFVGSDGTDFENAAVQIGIRVDGTVAADQIPGRLFISTANTSGSLTEAIRIDSSQRVVVGGAESQTTFFVDPALQVLGTGGADSAFGITCYSATDSTAPSFIMGKSGNATIGSHTTVANNEAIANMFFVGSDGTDFENAAVQIGVRVDGTVAANQIPGRLFISTANASGALTTAVTFDSSQLMTLNLNNDLRIDAAQTTGTLTTAGGYITVTIGGTTRYIPTYEATA